MPTVRLKTMDSLLRTTNDTILEAEGPGMRLNMGKVYTGISEADWDSMPDEVADKMSASLNSRRKRKERDRINARMGGNFSKDGGAMREAQDSLRQADATRSKVESINNANRAFWDKQSA